MNLTKFQQNSKKLVRNEWFSISPKSGSITHGRGTADVLEEFSQFKYLNSSIKIRIKQSIRNENGA